MSTQEWHICGQETIQDLRTESMTVGLRKDMETRHRNVFFWQSPLALPSKVKAQRKTLCFRPSKRSFEVAGKSVPQVHCIHQFLRHSIWSQLGGVWGAQKWGGCYWPIRVRWRWRSFDNDVPHLMMMMMIMMMMMMMVMMIDGMPKMNVRLL